MSEPEKQFISVEEARSITLASVTRLGVERVPLESADGRILGSRIVSNEDIPSFNNSAMDGYAFRHADCGGGETRLQLVGEIPCGVVPARAVDSGQCMRIMTGAQVPTGADTVIQQELVTKNGDVVQFTAKPPTGSNIRKAGSNVRRGQEVIEDGSTVTPGAVAILATLGYSEVEVAIQPRVAVFSSGDELVVVEAVPGPAQLRNSNGPALAAQVRAAGGAVASVGVLRDNTESIRKHIREVTERIMPDVYVISGGASVGDYDLVRQELESLGMTVPFWKVRQRPGKPFAFGLLHAKPVFMLPGNPVSASICFEQYVRPCIKRMLGARTADAERVPARFEGSIVKHRDLYYFARGIARVDEQGVLRVRPVVAQGSHVSTSLVDANCLIHLPEQQDAPQDGELVSIEWLTW